MATRLPPLWFHSFGFSVPRREQTIRPVQLCFLVINDKKHPVLLRIPAVYHNYPIQPYSAEQVLWYEFKTKQNDGNIYAIRIWCKDCIGSFGVHSRQRFSSGLQNPSFEFMTYSYSISISCSTSNNPFFVLFWMEIPASSDLALAEYASNIQLVRYYPLLVMDRYNVSLSDYTSSIIQKLKTQK